MAESEPSLPDGEPAHPGAELRTWESADVPPSQRFEYYRDAICDAFMPLAPERPRRGSGDFRACVSSKTAGAITVNCVRSDSHRVVRTTREIARSTQECIYLNLKREGLSIISQNGGSIALRPGEVGAFDAMTAFSLEHESHPRLKVTSLMIPYAALRAASRDFDPSQLPVRLSDHPRFGHTLVAACSMFDEDHHLNSPSANALSELIVHLTAAALATGSENIVRRRDHRTLGAAMLAAARDRLRRRAHDPTFCIATLAGMLGVTPRYLQKLFAGEGETFGRALLAERLDRAAAALRRPEQRHQPVGAIAYAAGFSDLSHFNRSFRARFACTPGDWRAR